MDTNSSAITALGEHATAVTILLLALTTLVLAIALLVLLARKPAAHTPSSAPIRHPDPTRPAIPPEVIAAIAATIDCLIDGPFRIVSIHRELHPPDPKLLAWSVEGRRQIFSSHHPH